MPGIAGDSAVTETALALPSRDPRLDVETDM